MTDSKEQSTQTVQNNVRGVFYKKVKDSWGNWIEIEVPILVLKSKLPLMSCGLTSKKLNSPTDAVALYSPLSALGILIDLKISSFSFPSLSFFFLFLTSDEIK